MNRHILTVDGIDGSGKSYLAQELVDTATAAGVRSILVRVDDFRLPISWDLVADELQAYYNDYFDLTQVTKCLDAFMHGAASFAVPTFDSVTERMTGHRPLTFDGAQLLVLEGVFIARVAEHRDVTRVYIHTSEAEARRRIMERDQKKGRTAEDVARRIDQRYFAAQRRYAEQHDPLASAQVIIAHETLGAPTRSRGDVGSLHPAARAALACYAD